MPRTKAHDVARQWIADNPGVPSRTAARHLHQLRPKLFTSVEHARGVVRLIVGQMGDRGRRAGVKDKSLFRKAGKQGDAKIVIPDGVSQFTQPVVIKGPCKMLIMGDLHIPYHDKRAVETAINYGLKQGCDTLYLNGDVGDFYAESRYDKDPEARDMAEEIDTIEQVLDTLAPHFKRKFYKCGNHDERWQKYLWREAPALGRIAKLKLDQILELEERGYQWIKSKQWATAGHLPIFHGHELPPGAAVNPARGAYLRVGNTIVVNHHHRTSQHVEPQALTQEQIVTWSFGCLCDMRPEYAVVNKWNLGFGIVEVAKNGEFELQNLRIDHTRGYKVYR